MKLLALIIAYGVSHFVDHPDKYRQFKWFKSWSQWLPNKINFAMREVIVILTITIPIFIIHIVMYGLFSSHIGGLIVSVLILAFCIGPKSLDEDVNSGEIHKRLGLRKNANISKLIKTMTYTSMRRWFGVFFWYIVLGIVGALMYRLSERLNIFTDKNHETKPVVEKLNKILNYPVAWVMVVSLAIASDFERIYKKCKPYFTLDNINELDDSFLYEATDFAVENCELDSSEKQEVEKVTLSVLKRMLIVWLSFVAILVIFV